MKSNNKNINKDTPARRQLPSLISTPQKKRQEQGQGQEVEQQQTPLKEKLQKKKSRFFWKGTFSNIGDTSTYIYQHSLNWRLACNLLYSIEDDDSGRSCEF